MRSETAELRIFWSVFHTSIGIDYQFGYDCHVLLHLAMDGEGSM
jgi:hypothetical protein